MKKLLYIILIAVIFLAGCEKKSAKTAPASLFLMEGEATAAGVKPGDGPKQFIDAYRDYTIQAAYHGQVSNYLVMSIEEIPYEDPISTLIATLFIDGEPISEETFCEENGIELSELPSTISSNTYLQNHDVIYRMLYFTWEDGIITDISSGELNYNETYETPRVYY